MSLTATQPLASRRLCVNDIAPAQPIDASRLPDPAHVLAGAPPIGYFAGSGWSALIGIQ